MVERTEAQAGLGRWHERLVCDPSEILGGAASDGDLPAAERARRERLREQADGITSFDTDHNVTNVVFTLGGHVLTTSLLDDELRVLPTAPGAFDPRLSPDGGWVGYIANRSLHVVASSGSEDDRTIVGEVDDNVSWGIADFNAAEEFNRQRGFWWSPDSTQVIAARVDDTPVRRWYIADPANPGREPTVHRYPEAGTSNAIVTLSVFDLTDGKRIDVPATPDSFPYLLDVRWTTDGLLTVWSNRAQTTQRIIRVDSETGETENLFDLTDPLWIELAPGTPVLMNDGSIVTAHDIGASANEPEATRTLARFTKGQPPVLLTPPNLQVRKVLAVNATHALVSVTLARAVVGLDAEPDPAQQHLVWVSLTDATLKVAAGGSGDPGVHDGVASELTTVIRSASLGRVRAEISVFVDGHHEHAIENFAEIALANPKPAFFRSGERRFPGCVLFPSDLAVFGGPDATLPVLLDPYGGPHAQRVVASRNAHTTSQWFADQGFIVLVIDGRGTPGLGPRFERAVHGNLAGPVLEDQVTGLHEAAKRYPQMDLSRVGIRGWSFGGYLAALAVLKRPDIFHAAIAGAPVTEWRLYDTGYTERYLGNPTEDASPYDTSSLLPLAKDLVRPLMLIHGLADDNVVAAHTLRLSSALLAAGRPHEVLPLSGVTHMTPQEVVAENLLKLQVEFLRRSLRITPQMDR